MNTQIRNAMMVRLENLLSRGGFTIEKEEIVKEIGEMFDEIYAEGWLDARMET